LPAPFGVLVIVYGLAMVACIVLSPLAGRPIAFADFKRLLIWPTCLLALAVVGIVWFGELIDGRRVLGLVLALAGGWLVVARL
jgi:hypothetical protein